MDERASGGARERLLDVSMLEPCEPMERALEALQDLAPGEYLRLMHRQEPRLLYPMIERIGMYWYSRRGERTAWEVLICHQDDALARAAVAAVAARDGVSLGGA